MSKNIEDAPINKNGELSDANSKIDAIKELLFGENMEAYNSEFEEIRQDLLKKKKELQELIDEVRNELFKNIDNLNTDVNIRMTDLENSLEQKSEHLESKKVDKKALGALLVNLGEKLGQ